MGVMQEEIRAAFENARQFDCKGGRNPSRFRALLVAFLRDLPEGMTVLELREELDYAERSE